jgi:hypothetical protein
MNNLKKADLLRIWAAAQAKGIEDWRKSFVENLPKTANTNYVLDKEIVW